MSVISQDKLRELAGAAFADSAALLGRFVEQSRDELVELAGRIAERFREGGKVLLFGNGGSAADAQHIAAEFVNKLSMDHLALPAVALTTDSSVLTCIANDRSYEEVFSRQIEALGREGDVAWGISTSGRSESVLRALRTARERGLVTVLSSGKGGERAPVEVDFRLIVPHTYSARIQEVQITMAHVVCELVEVILFGGADGS